MKVPAGTTTTPGIGVMHGPNGGWPSVSSSALERFEVFTADGSRRHDCTNTLSPAIHGLPSAAGFASWNASQSITYDPSHWPNVPPLCVGAPRRVVGGFTQRKRVLPAAHGSGAKPELSTP